MDNRDISRKIIHVDMDAFFVSVEERDNPSLRGRPVAVGYDGPRGVVSTANYVARRYGVHSAMAVATAHRRCPDLIVVEPHFERYKEVSGQIRDIFHSYTDLVEPLSLDEAYLDVTRNKVGAALAVDIAREIKARIRQSTSLTASAGVSYCKLLAKVASDWRKPDGLFVVHPDRALDFIAALPVDRIWGIGRKTAEKMAGMGITTGGDLRAAPLEALVAAFGKMGAVYYNFARGIDHRPVVTQWERKSIGCERTYSTDLLTQANVIIELNHLATELLSRMERHPFDGLTLTLKVKFADFTQVTRSITGSRALRTKEQILPLAKQLAAEVVHDRPIRLLGLSVSHPIEAGSVPRQLSLFED